MSEKDGITVRDVMFILTDYHPSSEDREDGEKPEDRRMTLREYAAAVSVLASEIELCNDIDSLSVQCGLVVRVSTKNKA